MDLPNWIGTRGHVWLAKRITDGYEGGRLRSVTRGLAHAAGVSHETVLSLARGRYAGSLRVAHAIAAATAGEVTAIELMGLHAVDPAAGEQS